MKHLYFMPFKSFDQDDKHDQICLLFSVVNLGKIVQDSYPKLHVYLACFLEYMYNCPIVSGIVYC